MFCTFCSKTGMVSDRVGIESYIARTTEEVLMFLIRVFLIGFRISMLSYQMLVNETDKHLVNTISFFQLIQHY